MAEETATGSGLMTFRQVAMYFGVSRRTVERWAKRGSLTPLRFGGQIVRFDPADIKAHAAGARPR